MKRAEPVPADFATWYQVHHPGLVRALRVVARDPDTATDAADEAMARCLLHWTRVRTMDSPAGWVYRVALHELRRVARRQRLEQRFLRRQPPVPATPEPVRDPLWDVVAGLPRRQRTAIALRYLADLPEAEIAQLMGVTRGTVASTLSDARHTLAGNLGRSPATGPDRRTSQGPATRRARPDPSL